MHVIITREIMRSRDAQCNTGEWPEMMMMSHLTQYYIKYLNGQFAAQNIETWYANSLTGTTLTALKYCAPMATHSFTVPQTCCTIKECPLSFLQSFRFLYITLSCVSNFQERYIKWEQSQSYILIANTARYSWDSREILCSLDIQ